MIVGGQGSIYSYCPRGMKSESGNTKREDPESTRGQGVPRDPARGGEN